MHFSQSWGGVGVEVPLIAEMRKALAELMTPCSAAFLPRSAGLWATYAAGMLGALPRPATPATATAAAAATATATAPVCLHGASTDSRWLFRRHTALVRAAGAVPVLASLAKHCQKQSLRKEAAWALSNICAGTAADVVSVIEARLRVPLSAPDQVSGLWTLEAQQTVAPAETVMSFLLSTISDCSQDWVVQKEAWWCVLNVLKSAAPADALAVWCPTVSVLTRVVKLRSVAVPIATC